MGLYYWGMYRGLDHTWRENSETFNFDNGESLTRVEDGTPRPWKMNYHYLNLNYSYQEPEKWFFNVNANYNIQNTPKMEFNSLLYPIGNPAQGVSMKDYSSSSDHTPSIDLYYERTLKNKQSLIFNVVGTYIDSSSKRTYTEKDDIDTLTYIRSNIDGNKYSLIGEGIYEKEFKPGKLSVGLKHTQSFTNNEYTGNSIAQTEMRQSETYMYTEFQGKIKKFGYSVGVGGTRSWFSQEGDGYQNYTFRPSLRLKYNFNDNSFLRYKGEMYSSAPSLSDLSNVTQIIDSLQIRRGNTNLKPVMMYNNSVYYDYHKGLFSGNLTVAHYYQKNPIMEETLRENNKFIRTKDNQRNWQKLNTELELKAGPIKDILTLSFTTGISHFDSNGNTYTHSYTNWYYRAEVMANYKAWTGIFQIQNHKNDFYGETLNYGENFHILMLMYKHKQLSVGAMMINPFVDNWRQGSESWSKYAPSKDWMHIRESSRLLSINLTYSFSFGRQYKSGQKKLNNSDKESGIVNGGK